MRVVSWDVGIRNAAYCIVEYEKKLLDDGGESRKRRILAWGLVNLLDKFEKRCCCGKLAKWTTGESSWCGIHVGGTGVVKCKTKSSKCHCGKMAKWVVKGRSKITSCDLHRPLEKAMPYKGLSSKTFPIDILKRTLIEELEAHPEFMFVDHVVIENQPSLTNPKMKALSETMYNWFLIRSQFDRDRYPNIIQSVEFMNPNAKIPQRKITREERKRIIMEICSRAIAGTRWERFYEKHSKKDDLADCYVQGRVKLERIFERVDKERSQAIAAAKRDVARVEKRALLLEKEAVRLAKRQLNGKE
jgi:hypothetical protein